MCLKLKKGELAATSKKACAPVAATVIVVPMPAPSWRVALPSGTESRAPEQWSAHRHVFHLLGNERVFQERIRLAMEQDGAIFERWDSQRHAQDPYQKDSDIELLAEEFVGARTETFELFKSLTPEQWSRTFTWPDGRVCDMAWLGEKVLWHALDHFATLLDMHGHFAPLQASG